MSKPASFKLACCVFLHAQDDQPLLTNLYKRIKSKYDALDLTPESLFTALDHCSHRYGLFITSDAGQLLEQLQPFTKALSQAKIWIISLNNIPPDKKPTYVANWRSMLLSGKQVQASFKAIKPEIKWAMTEMREHLAKEIRDQKQTDEQARLAFLEKLNHVYALHHTNSKLRTPFIAEQMGVSVSTLERKCEKLTGQLPSQLLTSYRLEKARDLVTGTSLHMSAIAKKTGFTSSSYFSVRYAEYFGQTPSQSRSQHHKRAS